MNARGSALVAAAVTSACSGEPTILPSRLDLPIAVGSVISKCSEPAPEGMRAACVSVPNDEHAAAIIETYKRSLDQRGFRFKQYFEGPNLVLLSRKKPSGCEVMIFGVPNPPKTSGEGSLLLEFVMATRSDCRQGATQ